MRPLALALILLVVLVPVARGNGDPASDVLLAQDSYLPYVPPVQDRLQTALENVLQEARDAGFPMKVALVQTANDLGAYPQLFNQPQAYADLLTRGLISLNPHGDPLKAPHVLVVMPGGFGGNNLGEGVDDALGPVRIQADAQSDGLARAAIEGVARLATVNGFPVDTPPEARLALQATDQSEERNSTSPLLFVAPALLLFAGLALAGKISKRRSNE